MSFSISNVYSRVATTKTRATLTAVLVFLLPFERIPSVDMFAVTIRASQLVGLALVILSIGPIINFYKSKPYLPKLLLPAFLFSYLLSVLIATDLKRAVMVFVFTAFVALVGSAIAATVTAKDLPRIEKFLYASTAIVLAVGFYQYFGDVFGLAPALTGLRDIYTKNVFGFPRVQSTALEPLYYGSFLLIPYCILVAKRLSKTVKISAYQVILLLMVCTQLFLTVSRGAIYGGIVATIALLGLFIVKRKTNIKNIGSLILLFIASGALALFLTWVPTQIATSQQKASDSTQQLIKQTGNFDSQDDRKRNRDLAIDAFIQQPVIGLGPGNFSDYAIKQYPPYAAAAPIIVNNEPLELLAEAGIVGFILFALLSGWIWLLVAMGYIKDTFTNQPLGYWVPALLVYCIALAVQYQTFSTLYVMHVWVVIGLLMAFMRIRSDGVNQ